MNAMVTHPSALVPVVGVTNTAFDFLHTTMTEAVRQEAQRLRASRAAIACAFTVICARLLSAIDRKGAGDFFHALSCAMNNGRESAELDRRRIARAMTGLIEADGRRLEE